MSPVDDSINKNTLKITVVGDGSVGKTCLLISYTSSVFPEEYVPTVQPKLSVVSYTHVKQQFSRKHAHISHTKANFNVMYRFETHQTDITVDGVQFSLHLWDTAGQETYDKLRPLSYPKTDCFILCYAINSPASLHNAVTKWMPEIKFHCPKADVIFVGTKMDTRGIAKESVSESLGKKMKSKIKASAYIECSSRSREGIEEIFVEAVRSVMRSRRNKSQRCRFL